MKANVLLKWLVPGALLAVALIILKSWVTDDDPREGRATRSTSNSPPNRPSRSGSPATHRATQLPPWSVR